MPRQPNDNVLGIKSAGWAPNITGYTGSLFDAWQPSGAFYISNNERNGIAISGYATTYNTGFSARRSSTVYVDGATGIMCESLTIKGWMIKY